MANPKVDDRIKSDAQIIIARSAIKTNDEVKAKAAYAKLQVIAKGELAAEALYYDAYFKNKEGKLMAKNFYALNDSFQATYILESVIENFTDYPDVVEEAKKELDIIKAEESKRNSSIQN